MDKNQNADQNISTKVFSQYIEGEKVSGGTCSINKGRTTPPPRYTEDTLIHDMENAWKFSKNPDEKALLKQTEGIGTARTREPTLANLIKRGLLVSKKVKKRHELTSSDKGRMMIGKLPIWLTDVGTTAKWEKLLSSIEKGDVHPEAVLTHQISYVNQVVERAKGQIKAS